MPVFWPKVTTAMRRSQMAERENDASKSPKVLTNADFVESGGIFSTALS
jgi:hypothetical protein